jgi:hypothetical protein
MENPHHVKEQNVRPTHIRTPANIPQGQPIRIIPEEQAGLDQLYRERIPAYARAAERRINSLEEGRRPRYYDVCYFSKPIDNNCFKK